MKNKYYISCIFLISLATGIISFYFFLNEKSTLGILFSILAFILFIHIVSIIHIIFRDMENFAEAAKYRDFSKRYVEKSGIKSNKFYRYFNEISTIFLSLNREKELQQQYLKKMLELIDTGILAYDKDNLDILWINNAFKNMFYIPEIRNIGWLKTRQEKLYDELINIPLGENRLITIIVKNQSVKTLINAYTFQTDTKTYKMIAFHNISATMDEIEANAWKGLLSVMTHEIMNSIAPVASLAGTLKKRMEEIKKEQHQEKDSDFEDIEFAMDIIHRRSEGLLRFADNYRNLSKTIIPEIKPVNLSEMLSAIYQLMQPSLKQKNILIEIQTDNPAIVANIDRNLIEQVLINFITNATYALREKEDPHIIMFTGIAAEGNPYITVADNGCGISPEMRDKIFIPFFSTKKNGTGIGLSLSREIVKLHKGTLQLQSKEGEGSAFTILLDSGAKNMI